MATFRHLESTTPAEVVLAYESMVSLGDSGNLGTEAARMRQSYQHRTGAFGPEDPWFENRARAFWDDALVSQGFARLAAGVLATDEARKFAECLERSHRGFFVVEDIYDDKGRALLVDAWSGAELFVRPVDDTQVLTLEHAQGAMDARVTASPSGGTDLFLLPGAYHHPADALEPAIDVLHAAAERGMSTEDTLDALMRMELVLRSSSRVKAGFAYRVDTLDQPASGLIGGGGGQTPPLR